MSALKIIARIRTDFPTKFWRSASERIVNTLKAMIVFEPSNAATRRAARAGRIFTSGLSGIFGSRTPWMVANGTSTVLGGNRRMGVLPPSLSGRMPSDFHRSDLDDIREHPEFGTVLYISSWSDGQHHPTTSNPYLPFTDSHPDAFGGFTDTLEYMLEVNFPIIC